MDFDGCIAEVESRPDVLALYLFGSQATGKTTPESDVDLAVLLRPKVDGFHLKLDLGARFAELLGRSVDLVVLGEDLDLTFRVLQHGVRLYERERDAVRSREADLAALYYDYKPYIDFYLQGVAESLRRG